MPPAPNGLASIAPTVIGATMLATSDTALPVEEAPAPHAGRIELRRVEIATHGVEDEERLHDAGGGEQRDPALHVEQRELDEADQRAERHSGEADRKDEFSSQPVDQPGRHISHDDRNDIDPDGGEQALRHRQMADAHEQTRKPSHQADDHVIAQEPVQPAQRGPPHIVRMKRVRRTSSPGVRLRGHFRSDKGEARRCGAGLEARDDRLGLSRAPLIDQPSDQFRKPPIADQGEQQRRGADGEQARAIPPRDPAS